MEATIIAIAASVGTLFSMFFFLDAWRDRWLVQAMRPKRHDLRDISFNQLIEEGIYLLLNTLFLVIALITIFSDTDLLRNIALLLLLSMPFVLDSRSFFRWVRRKKLLKDEPENHAASSNGDPPSELPA